MDPALRQVTRLPLDEIWDDDGAFGHRVGDLTRDDVRQLLREGPLRFVMADVGKRLRWIERADCFDHWRSVATNIASSETFDPENFSGSFAFCASEWEGRAGERLVVLEMHH